MPPQGWPLGLQPLNVRVHLADSWLEHANATAACASCDPHLSPSFSSSLSSDLDTESTMSHIPDTSTTLGSLIGIRSGAFQRDESRRPGRNLQERHLARNSKGILWTLLRCNVHSNNYTPESTTPPSATISPSSAPDSTTMTSPSLRQILELERLSKGADECQACINVMYEQEQQLEQDLKMDNSLYQTSTTLSNMCGCLVVVTAE